ncbi:MAG: hypothetical protein HY320_10200, partial [Armatimonadetes bacterium]|nr:hypothetical protein [Armatimonadota bacterium]
MPKSRTPLPVRRPTARAAPTRRDRGPRVRLDPPRTMNPRLWYDLAAIAMVVVGALLGLALWRPGLGGPAGRLLEMGARLLVGHVVTILPAAFFLVAVALVIDYRRTTSRAALVGAAGLLATVLGWLHLMHWAPGAGFDTVGPRLTVLLGGTADPKQVYLADGGFLGALLTTLLQPFGSLGARVVLAAVGLASLLLITDLTLGEIGRRIRERSRQVAARARARKAALAARKPERPALFLDVGKPHSPPGGAGGSPTRAPRRPGALRRLLGRAAPAANEIPALPPPVPETPAAPRRRTPPRVTTGQATPAVPKAFGTPPAAPGEYVLPPLDLLDPPVPRPKRIAAETEANIAILENTLAQFRIEAQVVEIADGPTVTRYEIRLGEGIKVKKILDLADNIAMSLAAMSVRVEAPIPGKSAIGIEVPKKQPALVTLRECLESEEAQQQTSALAFTLGKDVAGRAWWASLAQMPHLLVAGATNAGKSVCLNALIASILYRARPEAVKLLMIDPKRVELSLFEGIPHLCHPVVRDVKQAAGILRWALKEMERRYDLFARVMTRNLDGYNEKFADEPDKRLPYIVLVVDELADLMMTAPEEIERQLVRLAQMSRAVG